MRTEDRKNGLQLSQSALPKMKARLALLDAAISALQRYQRYSEEDLSDNAGASASAVRGVRSQPFLIAPRDAHAEKAS
jgi:hypothetical protein